MSSAELIWSLVRASGLMAVLTATVSVVLGATASLSPAPGATRSGRDLDRRLLRQYAHRSAGVVTLAMIVLHAALIVIDSYVTVTVAGVLVPFTAGYDAIALGIGTVAAYLFLVVAATGALRSRISADRGQRAWRAVHLTAYLAWGAAMLHGLMAGTDTGAWWGLLIYGGCAAAVAMAIAARVLAAGDTRRSSLAQQRRDRLAATRPSVPIGVDR